MRSRIATKVISAAAAVLMIELTDLALDKIGLSEERSRVSRAILKASASAAGGILIAAALGDLEEKTEEETGSSRIASSCAA